MHRVVPSPKHKPHLSKDASKVLNKIRKSWAVEEHDQDLANLAKTRRLVRGHEVRGRGDQGQGRVAGALPKPVANLAPRITNK